MELNKIYLGDNIETLKTLPDESVDCCITSPPYYALRDYGTGTWVGGDPNCPHSNTELSTRFIRTMTDTSSIQKTNLGSDVREYVKVCPDCGAVREDKQVGLEETPEKYIERLVTIFHEVKRVLKNEGTLWVNIGDSYWGGGWRNAEFNENSGDIQKGSIGTHCGKTMPALKGNYKDIKSKDLIGIPWLLAFALRDDGWYLRQDIIWHKPNPMPESVKDRCTKSHEYIFLLSKSPKYYFDYEAMQEDCVDIDTHSFHRMNLKMGASSRDIRFGGNKYGDNNDKKYAIYSGNPYNPTGKRNKRDVWSVSPSHYKEAHFATFPEELVFPMILAGCPKDGVVLDPFMGSGTTAVVAKKNHRNYIGCELNEEYVKMAENRIGTTKKRLF